MCEVGTVKRAVNIFIASFHSWMNNSLTDFCKQEIANSNKIMFVFQANRYILLFAGIAYGYKRHGKYNATLLLQFIIMWTLKEEISTR